MKAIGAKELRLHLDQVLNRVLGGEDIVVHHRFMGTVRLSALHSPATTGSEKLAGLHAFDAAPKRRSSLDPNKSTKELYAVL